MANVTGGEPASASPSKPSKGKATSERLPHARREPLDHVAVRIPAKDVARIDALAVKYATLWFKPSRSDMLRKLLLQALDAEDKLTAEEPPGDEDAP